MKNNFDLKGYMKSNKLGAYQQLNEMWYSDLQAIGQPMGMRHTAINEEEETIEEMGGVKTVGDKGKMATPNSRPNLGRHRSSDMLDKMSKKDHDKNTVTGAKAAAYKAPHMKEEEEDIFSGSDDADWTDNYGNDTSEWDTNIAGQTVEGWTAEESQGGAISWQNPKYPHTIVYATPGWEGVNGIAFEVYSDPEDGWNGSIGPMMQKVIGSHTDLWKTEKGYLALLGKAFTALEMKLTPSVDMEDMNEDEDPFGAIKTGIDKITNDYDEDMSDDDRFDTLGGDKIKAGIENLMASGFDYREILQFVKDTIASKRNY
jgi:hypothetical protein